MEVQFLLGAPNPKKVFNCFMMWNQGYTDRENKRWCTLRAIEWGNWPAFLSQPIVPVLLIFFEWWKVIGLFIILTVLWSFLRYRYVNIALAKFGVLFVMLGWITVPVVIIYFFTQHNYVLAIAALLWPVFLAPYLSLFVGGSRIGEIEKMFMKELGYGNGAE